MPDDVRELEEWFSLAYEELRRLAASVRPGGAGTTLNPTALVHEAWMKLSASPDLAPESRLHFKRIAARAMRQVLVDAARRRRAEKRGGDAVRVTFEEGLDGASAGSGEILALDSALASLADADPRQAAMVEYRFYGGFSVAETAEMLGVSEATVMRDWRAARAWLAGKLRSGPVGAVGGEA